MIIIGEKINGAIPSIRQAIAEHNEALIVERTLAQARAGADFLDCAPSTATEIEYETMVWLIGLMQGCTDVPLCIDSPNAALLARILEEGHVKRCGMVNSVNEEGTKCETIFPLIAGTPWEVVGLTCDQEGIPADPKKKVETAKAENIKIVALSGVLTLALDSMKNTIAALKEAGLTDVKVIVGGCPVTEDAANAMGADDWAYSPQKTVKVCSAWAADLA